MSGAQTPFPSQDYSEAERGLPPAPTLTLRHEWGDLAVGAALLAIAVWFFVTASRLDDYSGEGIGAADFPKGIAALLVVGVLVVCLGAIRRLASGDDVRMLRVRRYGHVAGGMVLLVVFPVLMTSIGYYLAMAVWLAAFLVLCGVRHPLHILAYVAGFLLFTKVVFGMLLGTPLS